MAFNKKYAGLPDLVRVAASIISYGSSIDRV